MVSAAPVDRGLTDVLDPLLGARFGSVLDAIDRQVGARIDEEGITVRRVLRSARVPWSRVTAVRLDSRFDLGLTFLVGLLPVTRAPVVGRVIEESADRVAEELGRRLVPALRSRAGWAVATIEQQTWRRDVTFERSSRVLALLYPALTHRLVAEATARGIPVIRDDEPA